jgi:GT2 family glycosyltransferase
MDVSIIYVNYNTTNLIINSINSVIELTKDISYEIIIVDNDSTLDEKNRLKHYCNDKNISIIESATNLGFGKANNLGAQSACGEYLFFLNPDTYLINNAIKELFLFAKESNISTCGGNLYSAALQPIHSYWTLMPSVKAELSALLSDIPLKVLHKNSHEHNLTNQPKEVAFITGADLMILRSLFNQLDGFDKDFFMYFEETELQYRIKQLGHKIYNLPTARIVHLESQTLKSREAKLKLFFTSRKIFYQIHRSSLQLKIANVINKISAVVRIITFSILLNKEKTIYWKTTFKQCL